MSAASQPRVQFVVSGKFIALLLIAAGLLSGGFYWYQKQQQTQERFRTPPYFISRGVSIVRPCKGCLALGKLAPRPQWKIGQPTEIPATEQRWFLAVEDPPAPVEVFGVLMLPVHPALRDNAAFGFDQNQMALVLYQGLQRMNAIEQPPAPVSPPDAVHPVELTVVPADLIATPGLSIIRLSPLSWRIEVPADNQWYKTGIPVIAAQKIIIRPTDYSDTDQLRWSATFGDYEYNLPEQDSSGLELNKDLTEDLPFVSGPDWLSGLQLRVVQHSAQSVNLDIELQLPKLSEDGHVRKTSEPWPAHLQLHQTARSRQEEFLKRP